MTSEVDFAKGASISFEKSKIMKTYNAIKLRMQSRFTKNGVLDAKLFSISSRFSSFSTILDCNFLFPTATLKRLFENVPGGFTAH